jgi:hypothetical protein
MLTYLLTFAIGLYATLFPAYPLGHHRHNEMVMITKDIVSTDARPLEALYLENIVAFESGWERNAIGRQGELGAFQIMPNEKTTLAQRKEWKARGAKEALYRLRTQGIQGYCGCSEQHPCNDMVEHRTFPAKLYSWVFAPPVVVEEKVADNP